MSLKLHVLSHDANYSLYSCLCMIRIRTRLYERVYVVEKGPVWVEIYMSQNADCFLVIVVVVQSRTQSLLKLLTAHARRQSKALAESVWPVRDSRTSGSSAHAWVELNKMADKKWERAEVWFESNWKRTFSFEREAVWIAKNQRCQRYWYFGNITHRVR